MSETAFLKIYTDGGSRGNPGFSACAFIVKDSSGKTIYQEGRFLGITTNNLAEYEGVISAFNWLIKNSQNFLSLKKIFFFLDSKLVVSQLNGIYKIKDAEIREKVFLIKIKEKETNKEIFYNLVSRKENYLADKLVNEVLDKALHER